VSVFVVVALYWGRAILIPVALATLLAFLLTPAMTALRRCGLGRVPAALLVVLLLFAVLGGAAYGISIQVGALLEDVPQYTARIKAKLSQLRPRQGGSALDRVRGALDEVAGELEKVDRPRQQPAAPAPQPVVIKDERGLIRRLPGIAGELGSVGLVLVLVIFILIERQDLRDRFIRLVGSGRITITTKAIDDAAQRISGYLLSQAMVNGTMGVVFGLGLLALGVPYALVWGVLLALARYVPFVGVWVAVLLPAALSLALSDGWLQPALVIALFLTIEISVNAFVEPILYSHRIGVSKVALIVAIGFWAWLWGPIGLILATPLTVCLVVLAKYVPDMDFVGVLIGDEPALDASASLYQRLLARDQDEAEELMQERLAEGPPEATWDGVLLPALVQARHDRARGRLDVEDERFIVSAARELVENMGAKAQAADDAADVTPTPVRILGCPARDEGDVVALEAFRQLVNPALCAVEVLPAGLLASELVTRVSEEQTALIVVASLPPGGLAHTRYLLKRLRACCPGARILVGRWGGADDPAEQRQTLVEAGADHVASTLAATRDQLLALAPVLCASGDTSVALGMQPART